MKCPYCGSEDTKVTDSRVTEGKKRRRRCCGNCGRRFTTYESVEMPIILVNKKDNTYEQFNRNKLVQGLSFAVKKRPVPGSAIIEIADGIENYCINNMLTEISTGQISDMVLEKLKKLDEVAYVRFASVNKDFNNVECFLDIISDLKTEDRSGRSESDKPDPEK